VNRRGLVGGRDPTKGELAGPEANREEIAIDGKRNEELFHRDGSTWTVVKGAPLFRQCSERKGGEIPRESTTERWGGRFARGKATSIILSN